MALEIDARFWEQKTASGINEFWKPLKSEYSILQYSTNRLYVYDNLDICNINIVNSRGVFHTGYIDQPLVRYHFRAPCPCDYLYKRGARAHGARVARTGWFDECGEDGLYYVSMREYLRWRGDKVVFR